MSGNAPCPDCGLPWWEPPAGGNIPCKDLDHANWYLGTEVRALRARVAELEAEAQRIPEQIAAWLESMPAPDRTSRATTTNFWKWAADSIRRGVWRKGED